MPMVKIRAALETALAAMGELIPSVTISTSVAGASAVINTATPHLLDDGVSVTLSGHSGSTPSLNGKYFITRISATSFSLLHPVTEAPFACTAGGAGGVCKPNLTAWDNTGFKPVPGVPYQKVNLVWAEPDDVTFGGNFHREFGFLQVSLFYPILLGTLDISTRAQLIRTTFKRGSTFEKDGVTVKILKTPAIMGGVPIDESYAVPIRISFQADIFS
jgi:hypothetical protein